MITLFEKYINDGNFETGDFLIIRSIDDINNIYLIEMLSKALIEESPYINKFFYRLIDEYDDYYDTRTIYYDLRINHIFTIGFSSRVIYDVIYKSNNEFEAIDKYDDLLKTIQNMNKYNL